MAEIAAPAVSNRAQMALASFPQFEGMLGELDATVITALLAYQERAEIPGPMAEFGVYYGRSAALLAAFKRPDEPLYLVDVNPYLEQEKLREIAPDFEFSLMDSADFITKKLGKASKAFRFIHSDGSHTFDNVYKDLAIADALLRPEGIFVVDDYYNPHYPQVPAAIFTYLAKEWTDLVMFLVGSNKCYLCRKGYHDTLSRYVLQQLGDDMTALGRPIRLSKTDRHASFDAFSFTGRPKDTPDEKFYGVRLYQHFYQ